MDVRNIALVGAGGVVATTALVAGVTDGHDEDVGPGIALVAGAGIALVGGARHFRARHDALLPGVAERYGITHEQLRATRLSGGSLNDALQGAIRMRIEGSGPLAERTIVPETRRAARMLSGPRGTAAESLVRNLLASRDDLSDTTRITSISFAESHRSFVANQALSRIDDGIRSAAGDPHVHPSAGTLDEIVHEARRGATGNAAVTSVGGTHVDMGTATAGREFERLVARRKGGLLGLAAWSALHPLAALHVIKTHALTTHPGNFFATSAAHELQHTSTYLSYRDVMTNRNRLDWLIEGAAVRAEWRFGSTTARMIGTEERYRGAATATYHAHHARTAQVLGLADSTGTAGDALLAGASGEVALNRLVDRIAVQHALTPDEQIQIRAKLHELDRSPQFLDDVAAMLATRSRPDTSTLGGGPRDADLAPALHRPSAS